MLTETLDVRIAGEARWTETLDGVGTGVAVCILPTYRSRTIGFLLNATAVIGITAGSRVADTLRFLKTVLAVGIFPAKRIALWWLNGCEN